MICWQKRAFANLMGLFLLYNKSRYIEKMKTVKAFSLKI
jgi:hypothetical protein